MRPPSLPASLWPVFANGGSSRLSAGVPGGWVGSLGSFRARCSVLSSSPLGLAPRPPSRASAPRPRALPFAPVSGASRLAPALAGSCSWPWVGGWVRFGCPPSLARFAGLPPLSPVQQWRWALRDSNQQPSPSPRCSTSDLRSDDPARLMPRARKVRSLTWEIRHKISESLGASNSLHLRCR
jgi:hypothetical protein